MIGAVNVDNAPEPASRYGVTGTPTLAFFQGGREVGRLRGAAPKARLKEAFEAALASTSATPA